MSHVDLIAHYFDAVNDEDWSALRQMWHPDIEWRATAARPRKGIDDVMTYYPRAIALYAKHYDDPVRFIEEGNSVTVKIEFTGENRQGKPIRFDAIDVFDFADGKIVRFSSRFDIDEIRSQM